MASTQIHAVIPDQNESEAIETAHTVFATLCPDGAVPIFDSYRLATSDDEPYIEEVTGETADVIESVWEGTVETLQEKTDKPSDVYAPDKAARARLYGLYDAESRPVLNRPHFSKLMSQDDLHHVTAIMKY